MEEEIQLQSPYDMQRIIEKCRKDPLFHVEEKSQTISFPVRVNTMEENRGQRQSGLTAGNKIVCCLIRSIGSLQQPKVALKVIGDELDHREYVWLKKHLSHRFQWHSPVLNQFYAAVADHPVLSILAKQQKGLPLFLYTNIFEGLVQSIIQQQVNFRFAQQLTYDLARIFGESVTHRGRTYVLLPTPSQLARLEVAELHQRKFSRRKAEYIIDLSRSIVKGDLDLQHIKEWENEKIRQEMVKIRGIGLWTAECVLLFCLGRPDIFPAADVGLQKAIQRVEGLESRPTADQCREWIRPYQRWASYISCYLWGSLGE